MNVLLCMMNKLMVNYGMLTMVGCDCEHSYTAEVSGCEKTRTNRDLVSP